jgi:hypothetical protein
MSTIKSSSEHLTLNADGASKDIKFQANGVEKASISSSGVLTATSFSGDGASLTGTGKVLQVVNVLTTTQASQTITTSDTQVGLLTKSITPLGANSKFLISVRWFGEVAASWQICLNIQQDGTRVNINGQGRGYGLAMVLQSYSATAQDDGSTPENGTFTTLVSTSSVVGTAIVFKLVADSSSTRTMWNNRCFATTNDAYERGTSELIITEIGA